MQADEKSGGINPRSLARVLNMCLAFGIAVLVIAYALGIHNITPQYTAILGGALLCFVAALVILMWHLAKRAQDSSRSLPRSAAWVVSILMAASAALLIWGTFVDQLKS
jgi:small-conductance mechanosensitive channel